MVRLWHNFIRFGKVFGKVWFGKFFFELVRLWKGMVRFIKVWYVWVIFVKVMHD